MEPSIHLSGFGPATGFGVAEALEAANPDSLSADTIRAGLGSRAAKQIRAIDVLDNVASTNDFLLEHDFSDIHGRLVVAERQAAGRGRRGRAWRSPRGNIFMSVGWRFDATGPAPEPLSLIMGVCVCRALSSLGLSGHGVKWPNDIQVDGEKLAGILVDLKRRHASSCAVIGVGINVNLRREAAAEIDQPWTDLSSQAGIRFPDRNAVIAKVIDELAAAFEPGSDALAPFLERHWDEWDLLHGKRVRIAHNEISHEGAACGVTPGGALRVEMAEGVKQTFVSGDVSVRHA